jgi:hypothetical protein
VAKQDQLDSLASVGPPKSERAGLTHCQTRGEALPFPKWRMLLLCDSVRNSQRHGSVITGPVTRRKQELATSWNRWSSIWNWASWLLHLAGPFVCNGGDWTQASSMLGNQLYNWATPWALAGPFFMLLLALIFGPCILNAITHFISSQMEAIKFLVIQYRPLGQKEPDRIPGT